MITDRRRLRQQAEARSDQARSRSGQGRCRSDCGFATGTWPTAPCCRWSRQAVEAVRGTRARILVDGWNRPCRCRRRMESICEVIHLPQRACGRWRRSIRRRPVGSQRRSKPLASVRKAASTMCSSARCRQPATGPGREQDALGLAEAVDAAGRLPVLAVGGVTLETVRTAVDYRLLRVCGDRSDFAGPCRRRELVGGRSSSAERIGDSEVTSQGLHPLISPRSLSAGLPYLFPPHGASVRRGTPASARSARLGPLCGAQRVQNSHNEVHSGPMDGRVPRLRSSTSSDAATSPVTCACSRLKVPSPLGRTSSWRCWRCCPPIRTRRSPPPPTQRSG